MRALVKLLKKILSFFGYEFQQTEFPQPYFNNFVNLTQAYEYKLNEHEELITADDLRPKLLMRLLGTPPSEAYFIVQAIAKTRGLEGEICEFGVAQGETSALIANEIRSSNKKLHLFDSFEGLPEPTEQDRLKDDIFSLGSMQAYAGTMACPEEMVRARLEAIAFPAERYVVHEGFIDKVVTDGSNLPESVSFAFVDFDFYEPIKLALDFLHQKTITGSIIIVDDYDYFSTGAKTAVDEFLEAKNVDGVQYECLVPDSRYGHFAILTKCQSGD